jgi:hypothetical protein
LIDPRFAGRVVYVFDAAAQVRLLVAGFFLALALLLLGLVQNYRLEGVRGALTRGRLSFRATLLLLLPLPLFALAGWVADDNLNRPLRVAPLLVDDASSTGRSFRRPDCAGQRDRGTTAPSTACAGSATAPIRCCWAIWLGKRRW